MIKTSVTSSAATGLETLPDDLLVKISHTGGPRTAARLSCVSRDMDRLAGQEDLWQGFYKTYIDPTSGAPQSGARAGFARRVPSAGKCLAAKACLGELGARTTLVAFPRDGDTSRFCIAALARDAALSGRPFRLLDAARIHASSDLPELAPDEVCVIKHVEVISARAAIIMSTLIGAANPNDDGTDPESDDDAPADERTIVLLHEADLDECDGVLLQRVERRMNYCPEPVMLPIDPLPAHIRVDG